MGTSGTSGVSPVNGTNGKDGTSGKDGTAGQMGSDGTSGTSGVNGKDGTAFGSSGTSGISGTIGTSGSSGSSGITTAIPFNGATDYGVVIYRTTPTASITVSPNLTWNGTNAVMTGSLLVQGSISASAFNIYTAGTPELQSATNINLTAGTTVIVTQSPFRLTTYTDAQTGSLTPSNGDMIYNSTTHKFMGYANGAWVQLH